MGVFQTLSAGNIGQLGAPGNGVPADATPGAAPPTVRPSHTIAVTTNAIVGLLTRRLTAEPLPLSTVPHPSSAQGRPRPELGGRCAIRPCCPQ